MASPRGGRPTCLVCGRGVSHKQERMRLPGGAFVHRGCGTYDTNRRRTDSRAA